MGLAWIPYSIRENPSEYWVNYVASFGFFLLMCYIFVGIAIASDIFMNAIEKICGATKTVKIVKEEDGVIVITTKQTQVWNETVANLTLMALGSSAPEILLSAIEISEGLGEQSPGDLGPGTIIGSAAYNLMIISAVCIMSIPKGSTSRIKLYKTFAVTSLTSLLAYIWMAVVLKWWTPDIVTLEEALLTLSFFPLMVLVAYWADQDFCLNYKTRRSSVAAESTTGSTTDAVRSFYFADNDEDNLYDADGNYDKKALMNLYHKLTDVADLKPEEIVNILAAKLIQGKKHNRMWYRMQASRAIMGGGKMIPVLDEKLQEVVNVISDDPSNRSIRKSMMNRMISSETLLKKAVVEFQAATLAVAESVGQFHVVIHRTGREDVGFKVQVDTADGTAKKDKEYYALSELVTFDPYEKEKQVIIKVINNAQWNPDHNFFIKLAIPQEYEEKMTLGKMRAIEIIIEDDDKPGKISFEKRGYVFKDSMKAIFIEIVRNDGTDGVVSAMWKVVPGKNCKLISPDLGGKLEFQPGEKKKFIEIPLISKNIGKVEGQDETFEVSLSNPEGGAKLGKIGTTTCAISSDQNFKLEINNVVDAALLLAEESDEDVTYLEQIRQAVIVNGGDAPNATKKDWALHILIFPQKLVCSLIPPPGLCGGWLCFLFALLVVGLLTKLVGDTAGHFGDCLGIDPTITAITFVALGTSLPDTFASRIAAMNDKTADNAVGNVTGSNSVNVFLGLGVPWTIGAVYYMAKNNANHLAREKVFCVPAGNLTFNVIVFSACAFVALLILTFRRYSQACGSAELGGPERTKWISAVALISLWMLYIALSSWQATDEKNKSGNLTYDDMILDPKNFTNCATYVKFYKENRHTAEFDHHGNKTRK